MVPAKSRHGRLSKLCEQDNVVRPILGLIDKLLESDNIDTNTCRHLADWSEAVVWLKQSRQGLCGVIGRSASDEYDRLIHACLVKGGLPYMREQYGDQCLSLLQPCLETNGNYLALYHCVRMHPVHSSSKS